MQEMDYILDTENSAPLRGDKLIRCAEEGRVDFDFVVSLKGDEYTYVRSSVAHALKNFSDRRDTLQHLLELMCDHEIHVRGDAVLAAGKLGDSRATFPLINYFKHVPYEVQRRVFMALISLGDPRAVCFLDKFSDRPNDVGSLAKEAFSACANNKKFFYSFAGREDMWEDSLQSEGRILVDRENILDSYGDVIQRTDRPQTYIIDRNGRLWIGGENLHEHVYVAKGEKVLSAGEIIFERDGKVWKVGYINNRSNGYLPDEKSFVHVFQALANAGIKEERRGFSESFPRDGFCSEDFLSLQKFFNGASLDYL